MLRLAVRRLVLFVPMWVAVSIVAFVVVHATPGDPSATFLGQDTGVEGIAAVRHRLGLDAPYVVQLARWVIGSAHGDFGESFFLGRSVAAAIGERLPVTFSLAGLALLVTVSVGVPLGILASLFPNSWRDGVTVAGALLFLSVPEFVVGIFMITLLAVSWRLFPVGGYVALSADPAGWLAHLVMPALALGLAQAALLARMTRASMLQVLGADHVRTARAKGVAERRVVLMHGLRNAAISIVTVIGLATTLLLSGAFITETLFELPGVGSLMVSAVLRRDYPVIQGALLVIATIVLVVNIAVDVSYAALNPTMRRG
ncbi:MAG TPA: ABC transporter permease [Acetobacteraceae bacterium]|jgi:peptide/nickel transport system permease protein|nr:ABC transporter permease [Acetobacteraceae bacterium]